MAKQTEIKSHLFGRDVRPLAMSAQDCAQFADLSRIGIHLPPEFVRSQIASLGLDSMAMDDNQGLVTTASISTPVQFLQAWLPGFVRVMTTARKIDEILGVTTAGSWEDEEVVQGVLEGLGNAVPYGDYTNVPLASWNVNFERRSITRFEKGIRVGMLEDARSARVRINNAAEKRAAAAVSLDITRNRVGFFGYNGGNNRTYGLLNDPSLPGAVTAAATGTGGTTTWSTKTFLNITADIRGMFARLRNASGDQVDPKSTKTTMVVATSVADYMTVVSDFGISVADWLGKNYPNCRLISAPEFNGTNGGANMVYLFADSADDGSTDGGATIIQVVPAKFQALGTEKQAKGYVEDFSNATAGIFVKRPTLVQRLTGV
jgi:hypothetical protein